MDVASICLPEVKFLWNLYGTFGFEKSWASF